MIVYISIGNSDDKLTQAEWARFIESVDSILEGMVAGSDGHIHGRWFSAPEVPWQSACWCIEAYGHEYGEGTARRLRWHLSAAAAEFRQDSIAWAEVPLPDFVKPGERMAS